VRLDFDFDKEAKTYRLRFTPVITLRGPARLGPIRKKAELTAERVEALIAKLTKPKRKPKPTGRHDHPMKDDILAEYDRRVAEGEPHENADLERWAADVLKKSPKYANTNVTVPHVDTIGRWLREERGSSPT
jgi:hypothetical protein